MLTLSEALSAVSVLGTKVTGIKQIELPAQVPLAATPKSAALVPVMLWLSVSVKGDKLVTVSFKILLADCATLPNPRLAGVTVAGIVGPVLSATMYGLSGSGLSETDRV